MKLPAIPTTYTIESLEQFEAAEKIGKRLAKQKARAKALLDELTAPHKAEIDGIKSWLNPKIKQAETIIKALADARLEYQNREKQAEKQNLLEASRAMLAGQSVTAVQRATAPPVKQQASRDEIIVEVQDIRRIPAQYLNVNEAAIKRDWSRGAKIPGCRIYKKQKVIGRFL